MKNYHDSIIAFALIWYFVVFMSLTMTISSDYKTYSNGEEDSGRKVFWKWIGVPIVLLLAHVSAYYYFTIVNAFIITGSVLIIYYAVVMIKTIKERRRLRCDGPIVIPSDPYSDGTYY